MGITQKTNLNNFTEEFRSLWNFTEEFRSLWNDFMAEFLTLFFKFKELPFPVTKKPASEKELSKKIIEVLKNNSHASTQDLKNIIRFGCCFPFDQRKFVPALKSLIKAKKISMILEKNKKIYSLA